MLKVLIYRDCVLNVDRHPGFLNFMRGVKACGDECSITRSPEEECDVAVHPSGPKGGRMENIPVSLARSRLIARYPTNRIVVESPIFRQGEMLGRKKSGEQFWRLGWNGFLRHDADYMNENSPHDRWEFVRDLQEIDLKPQHVTPDGPIIIMQQKNSDASVRGLDIPRWSSEVAAELLKHTDAEIVVRKHPKDTGGKHLPPLAGVLTTARAVVTYTSLSAIETVCAGVPMFADEKSLSWPMANIRLDYINSPILPADSRRLQWLADLAYTQWSDKEIASGAPWDRLRKRMITT